MRKMMLLVPLTALLALACGGGGESPAPTPTMTPQSLEPTPTGGAGAIEGSQQDIVEAFIAQSQMVRVACLDLNTDGQIDAADAEHEALDDITGDGTVDDADREVLRRTNLVLPEGRPAGCAEGHPRPDWQVAPPAVVDCAAGRGGVVVVGIGGGIDELSDPLKATGVRWMLVEIGEKLEDKDIPHQLVSVSPALTGTEQHQPDAVTWVTTYLATQLGREPCLRAVLLGHSHGGVAVTAIATRLEEAGLGDQILLTIPLDRITALYAGDSESIPHTTPVFNIFQTNDELLLGRPIDQPNVENWDASGEQGPRDGHEGGPLVRVDHVNIDNSQAVLDRINERIIEASCPMGLC